LKRGNPNIKTGSEQPSGQNQQNQRTGQCQIKLGHHVRVALIVSTAIVAAKETLKPFLAEGQALFFATLSILVAIRTALDAWLKPRGKWKGFYGGQG
jgi:hypothetical protein